MYEQYDRMPALSDMEALAWSIYCEETAGDMDVKDFWHELQPSVKLFYLEKASSYSDNG